jgi:hypothetical protein
MDVWLEKEYCWCFFNNEEWGVFDRENVFEKRNRKSARRDLSPERIRGKSSLILTPSIYYDNQMTDFPDRDFQNLDWKIENQLLPK